MASSKQAGTLRAGFLLRAAGAHALDQDVSVRHEAGRVLAIEAQRPETGPAQVRPRSLLMPPLANAHDHGRGLKTLAYGVADAPVEAWVPATYTLPAIDPYLVAATAFARMARSGIGSTVHCHLSREPAVLLREAQAVARAARDVGVRVGFVVPLRDRHRLAYAPDEAILSLLQPADAQALRERSLRPLPSIDAQIALVQEVAAACEHPGFQVQYGPVAPEFCSDALLERVAQASAADGRRVHMHLLESRYQREWADSAYPQGLVPWLADIGLLSSRLTVAHGTWLRPADCALLAQHGAVLSVNTSSNLRLRSGIAPLRHIREAGLRFAVGLDALALDDDDDILREARLLRLLHAGQGFEVGVTGAAVLDAACRQGAAAAGCVDGGEIAVGGPADLLLLDLQRASADIATPFLDLAAVLHGRATAADVHTLVIGGRTVVEAGRVTGVDEVALRDALAAEIEAHAGALALHAPVLARYQAQLGAFYGSGGHC